MPRPEPILVTGASGFLGSRLVERLLAGGYTVEAACRTVNDRLKAAQIRWPGRFRHLLVDFREDLPRGVFSQTRYGAVVHLASYVPSFRRANPADELVAVDRGVIRTTVRLLQEIRGCTGMLLLGSSIRVYGRSHTGLVDERTACQPTDIYGVGKLASEGLCRCFAEAENLQLAVLRLTQLYGDGEPHGLFLQRVFLPQARQGGQICLVHGGKEQKDLLWVDDAAEGIVQAIGASAVGTFNLSAGVGVSVRQIAEMLHEFAGGTFSIETTDDVTPIASQVFDCRLARATFNFKPKVDIREGLHRLWR